MKDVRVDCRAVEDAVLIQPSSTESEDKTTTSVGGIVQMVGKKENETALETNKVCHHLVLVIELGHDNTEIGRQSRATKIPMKE